MHLLLTMLIPRLNTSPTSIPLYALKYMAAEASFIPIYISIFLASGMRISPRKILSPNLQVSIAISLVTLPRLLGLVLIGAG